MRERKEVCKSWVEGRGGREREERPVACIREVKADGGFAFSTSPNAENSPKLCGLVFGGETGVCDGWRGEEAEASSPNENDETGAAEGLALEVIPPNVIDESAGAGARDDFSEGADSKLNDEITGAAVTGSPKLKEEEAATDGFSEEADSKLNDEIAGAAAVTGSPKLKEEEGAEGD